MSTGYDIGDEWELPLVGKVKIESVDSMDLLVHGGAKASNGTVTISCHWVKTPKKDDLDLSDGTTFTKTIADPKGATFCEPIKEGETMEQYLARNTLTQGPDMSKWTYPQKYIPVDTKVLVWDNASIKRPMYFSHFGEDGRVHCFRNGATSWSVNRTSTILTVGWDHGELAND